MFDHFVRLTLKGIINRLIYLTHFKLKFHNVSILESPTCLVYDVKYGTGCFSKTYEDGVTLAHLLCATTKGMGIETTCFVTNMNAPLGQTVGNGLEVIESLDILKGGGPKDVIELVTSQGNSSKLYVALRVALAESCFIRSTFGLPIIGGLK